MKKNKILIYLLSLCILIVNVSVTVFAREASPAPTNESGYVIKESTEAGTTTTKSAPIPTKPKTTTVYQVIDKANKEKQEKEEKMEKESLAQIEKASSEVNQETIRMNATFSPDVPESISGDINISIYNKSTKKTYNYVLKEKYDYFLIVEIPMGAYIISKCEIPGNENNRYVVDHGTFLVGKVMNTLVRLEIIDTESSEIASEETLEETTEVLLTESTSEETTREIEVVVQPEKKNNLTSTIFSIVIIIVVLALYILKKNKNKDNTDKKDITKNNLNRF